MYQSAHQIWITYLHPLQRYDWAPKFKQVVKGFWPQAASQMTDFSRGKVNVTPASRGNAVGCSSRADAVIDFFWPRAPQQWLTVFFNWSDKPLKLPIPPGNLDPNVKYTVPWDHPSHPPSTFTIRSTFFAGSVTLPKDRHTDAKTDHAIPFVAAMGRIQLLLQCGLKIRKKSMWTNTSQVAPTCTCVLCIQVYNSRTIFWICYVKD